MPTLRHTAKPTGMLGNPCSDRPFITIDPGDPNATPEKKVLIYTDPILRSNQNENDAIKGQLSFLKKEGFTLLYPTLDGFQEWDESQHDAIQDRPIYSDDQLYRLLLEKKGIRADDAYILDYFNINENFFLTPDNFIKWSDFTDNQDILRQIIQLSQRNNYKITFKKNKEIEQFLTLCNSDQNALFLPSTIKKIDASGCAMPSETFIKIWDTFDDLEEFHINTLNVSADLEDEERMWKILKGYRFDNQSFESNSKNEDDVKSHFLQTQSMSKKRLKKIEWSQSWMTSTAFKNIVANNPKLEELILNNCKFISYPDKTSPAIQVGALTKISMDNTNIHPDELSFLFNNNPQLKEIKLSKCSFGMDELKIKKSALQRVQNIDLSRSTIQPMQLHMLITNLTQLRSLNVSGCKYIETIDLAEFFNFSENLAKNLEKLDISNAKTEHELESHSDFQVVFEKLKILLLKNSTIHADLLANLLEMAPFLEELNLHGCKNIAGGLSSLAPGALKNLKYIHMPESKIYAEDLEALLNAAPHVEEINLSDCYDLIRDGFSSRQPGSLKNLRVAVVAYTGISANDVTTLCNAAPNLEELNVRGCPSITGCFASLPPNSLKKLTDFSISMSSYSSMLTADDINGLLHAAPHLHTLDLSKQSNLVGGFSALKPGSLPQLTEIDLSETDINQDDMFALLNAAPNLIKINFSQCYNLDKTKQIGDRTLNLLKHVKELNMKNSRIKNNLLQRTLDCIIDAMPQLEKIDLSDCYGIFTCKIKNESLASVKTMNLSSTNMSAEFLEKMIQHASQLTELEINDPIQPIDLVFLSLSGSLSKKLKKISLNNSNVLGHDIKQLLQYATQLTSISLNGCKNISPQFIEEITHQYKNINITGSDVSGNRNIDKFANADTPSIKTPSRSHGSSTLNHLSITTHRQHASENYFDGSQKEVKLTFKRYFHDFAPNKYRLSLWKPDLNSLRDIGLLDPSQFHTISEDTHDYAHDGQYRCHHGVRTTTVADGKSILLPSLDAQEKLHHLKIVSADGRLLAPDQYTIQHNAEIGLYQVVLRQAGDFTIHFDVAILKTQKLPDRLAALTQTYPDDNKPLSEPPKQTFSSWREFAKHVRLNQKKAGPCRHRTIAAYDELITMGYKEADIRIVDNDVHTYLEVKEKDHWHILDLGGTSAKLQEEKMPVTPLPTTSSPSKNEVKEEIPPPSNQIATIQEEKLPVEAKEIKQQPSKKTTPISPKEAITTRETTLLLTTSDNDLSMFYAQQQQSNPTFIVSHPEEISLEGNNLDPQGNIISGTSLAQWLANKKPGGTLYIDTRAWKANELAQLNDLLDGRIEKQEIPSDIKIFLIDHPKRGYYGPDFRRRVPNKTTVPLADDMLPKADPSLSKNETLVIDLFHSAFWQRHLAGTRQLTPQKNSSTLSLPWRDGELLKALQDDKNHQIKNIVFKNPPLNDPSFTSFMAELQGLKQFSWANQTYTIPANIRFYQDNHYDWGGLANQASLHDLRIADKSDMHVLSDANILSFIQDPTVGFDAKTDQLISKNSLLSLAQKESKILNVVCTPGLSDGAIAELLTEAKKQDVTIRFYAPDPANLPKNSPLTQLKLSPVVPADEKLEMKNESSVSWQIHEDSYSAARSLQEQHPNAYYFDISSLEPSELSRYATLDKNARQALFKTGLLAMSAPLSDLVKKLMDPQVTVILQGKISPLHYDVLTSLTLGTIEGTPFPGKLIILPPPEQREIAEAITGQDLPIQSTDKTVSFATQECIDLQQSLNKVHQPVEIKSLEGLSDEARAQKIDDNRLHGVQAALKINPWVMIEGTTGIGKTHFLDNILPNVTKTEHHIEEWLKKDNPSVLIIDEASFLSELSGEGENFLERFKSLKNQPPGFLWKGQYHELTSNHRVVFAFNPESYGAGRSTSGFLTEQKLAVSFKALPDFYVRARLINPLLEEAKLPNLRQLSDPVTNVYNWLVTHYPDDILITPREIKLMINLLRNHAKQNNITDPNSLAILAAEVAHHVGRQTLLDKADILQEFDKNFAPLRTVLNRTILPKQYAEYQRDAYTNTMNMLETMQTLIKSKSSADLGLGGILFEGESGIGKTYFLKALTTEWSKKSGQEVIRISPTTPYHIKVEMLREAFKKGALVVAEEMNTSLWPNKILNNFLMGCDEHGKPAKEPEYKPGFMLLATQNPPSFVGRSEEDPALRRRLFKMKLDWPFFEAPKKQQTHEQVVADPVSAAQNKQNTDEKVIADRFFEAPKKQKTYEQPLVDPFSQLAEIKRVIRDYIQKSPSSKTAFGMFQNTPNSATHYLNLLSTADNHLQQAVIVLALLDDSKHNKLTQYMNTWFGPTFKRSFEEAVLKMPMGDKVEAFKADIHQLVHAKEFNDKKAQHFMQTLALGQKKLFD